MQAITSQTYHFPMGFHGTGGGGRGSVPVGRAHQDASTRRNASATGSAAELPGERERPLAGDKRAG